MSTKFTLAAASLAAVMILAPLAEHSSAQGGWTPLFDGKSLNGWRGYKKADASETRWKVENGTLTLPANDGKDTRGARDIITTDTFDQFELVWEWKISPGGNSGLKNCPRRNSAAKRSG